MDPDEEVLVVPTALVRSVGHFEGFSSYSHPYTNIANSSEAIFMPRKQAETDENFKQVIPYVLFTAPGYNSGSMLLFRYFRSPKQGEDRLHGKASIGVGGHINPVDAENATMTSTVFEEAVKREILEEVRLSESEFLMPPCVGVINVESSSVDRVHLGIVYRYELQSPELEPREVEGMLDCGFISPQDAYRQFDQFEEWSKLVLQSLYPVGLFMSDNDFVGLNPSQAAAIALKAGVETRVINPEDGVATSMEYNPFRLNLEVEQGKVAKVHRG